MCLGISGCVVIPIPTGEHLKWGRGQIESADTAFLEVGKTKVVDVLLRFGEPNGTLKQKRILVYKWITSWGYVVMLGLYSPGGGADQATNSHFLLLEFDDAGVLRRYELKNRNTFVSGPFWDDRMVKSWAGQE